jgi:acyl carrier protein
MPLTFEILVDYVRAKARLDDVRGDTPLFSTGALDSVSQLDLIMMIESEAGIAVSQADVTLDNLDTIDRILAFVARQNGAAPRGG